MIFLTGVIFGADKDGDLVIVREADLFLKVGEMRQKLMNVMQQMAQVVLGYLIA